MVLTPKQEKAGTKKRYVQPRVRSEQVTAPVLFACTPGVTEDCNGVCVPINTCGGV